MNDDTPVWEPPIAGSDVEHLMGSLEIIEEYGRHTGHADILREAIDGRVREDPPNGWRPGPER